MGNTRAAAELDRLVGKLVLKAADQRVDPGLRIPQAGGLFLSELARRGIQGETVLDGFQIGPGFLLPCEFRIAHEHDG